MRGRRIAASACGIYLCGGPFSLKYGRSKEMDAKLQGKVAIVTGASSGIGAETAKELAAEGAKVVLTARRQDRLDLLVSEIQVAGGCAVCLAGDMAKAEFCEALVAFTVETFGAADILVCSAGMALRDSSLDMTEEAWNQVMSVNLTAPLLLSQACIRQFLRQGGGGKIVYISSTAGKNVNMGASPSYGASKAGLLYLTRHFATEFAKEHIYVNAICPGPVDSEITRTWTPEHRQSVLNNLPMGRMGEPEDIAHLAVFLASALSDYITGESILINGGRYLE